MYNTAATYCRYITAQKRYHQTFHSTEHTAPYYTSETSVRSHHCRQHTPHRTILVRLVYVHTAADNVHPNLTRVYNTGTGHRTITRHITDDILPPTPHTARTIRLFETVAREEIDPPQLYTLSTSRSTRLTLASRQSIV